MTFIPRQNLLF